jgi:TP901 family phage tail tape measure protein
MAQTDGDIIIGTKLDDSEFSNGLNKLGSIATKAMASVTAAIGAASIAVIKLGSEFESANAKASTLFGDANVNMTQYSQNMLDMSNRTGVAATELGNTMYDALSAGIPAGDDMSEAMGFLEKNTKLAKAGFADINTVTTASAKVLNAYKMDVSETDKVHKILIQTQNKGITTVGELGSVLAQVTPTAAAMKVSFEQVGAALANMTAQGTPTAQATTQLNQLIAELGKNGTTGAKGLAEATKGTEYAGKGFSELMKEGVPLNTLLDLMSDYAKKNNLSMIDMFSSIEAGKAALAVSGQNSQQFTNNLKAMSTEADVVGEAYDKVTNTFEEKSKKAVNALKNVGIAAYDKFKEPLKDSMDAAVESIDSLNGSLSNGKLGKSVDKIAKSFAGLVKITINFASKAIPVVVNGFSLFADNAEIVVIALTAVGAIMASYKAYTNVIMPMKKAWDLATAAVIAHYEANRITMVASAGAAGGMTALQVVIGVMSGKLDIATAKQWLFNTALNANPAMVVTTAVIALGAALAGLAVYVSNHKSEVEQLSEELEEEAESFKEVQDAAQEQGEANLAEISNVQRMKDELDSLIDSNGRVKKGFEERASFLVGELAEATGQDIKLVDGQIKNYSELSESIQKSIDKMKAEAILEAHKEEYTKALSKQADAQKKLKEAQDQYNSALSDSNKYIEDYTKTHSQSGLTEAELRKEAKNAWKDYVSETEKNLKKAEDNYNNYNEVIIGFEQAQMDIKKGNFNTTQDLINQESSAYAKSADEKLMAYAKEISCLKNHTESLKNLRSDANKETVDSGIASDNEMIEQKKNAMQQLVNEVVTASPKYSSALMDMVSNGQTVFNENGNLTTAAQKKLTDVFISQNSLTPEYSNILTKMVNDGQRVFENNGNLTSSVQKKLIDVFAKENSLSPQYATELKNMASKGQTVFNSNGNLTKAAKKKLDDAIKAAGDKKTTFGTTLKEISEKGKEKMEEPDYESTGKHLIDGAKKGVENNEGGFLSKIGSLAEKALSSLSKIWDIHSPSKEAEYLTEMLMRGLEKGVVTNEDLLLDPVENVASNATDTISNIFDTIGSSKISAMIAQMQSEAIAGQMRVVDSAKIKVEYDVDKASFDNKLKNKLLLNATNNNEQIIDYNRLAQVLVQALQGVEFEFDERGFIRLVRKVI